MNLTGLFSDVLESVYGFKSDIANQIGGGTGERQQGPVQPGADPLDYESGPSQEEIDMLLAQMMGESNIGKGAMQKGTGSYRQAPDARQIVTPIDQLMAMSTQQYNKPRSPIQMQGINQYAQGLFGG